MEDSKQIDDGGFAFPGVIGPQSEFANGMTLRDYLAAKALPDFIRYEGDRLPFRDVAQACYEMADAMLAARKVGA